MSIYEQDNIFLTIDSSDLVYAATPGSFTSISVIPESYRTRERVPYLFTFVTKNALPLDSQVSIKIPEALAFEFTDLILDPIETMRNDILITDIQWTESTRTLLIENAFDTSHDFPV